MKTDNSGYPKQVVMPLFGRVFLVIDMLWEAKEVCLIQNILHKHVSKFNFKFNSFPNSAFLTSQNLRRREHPLLHKKICLKQPQAMQ